jgi:hypothetical protein
MNELLGMLERLDELCVLLMGMELADDRGNLSADQQRELAALKVEQDELVVRSRALWEAMPSAAPADAEAHDRLVGEAIACLHASGGQFAGVSLADLEARARRTCRPERHFDVWPIQAVHRICRLNHARPAE